MRKSRVIILLVLGLMVFSFSSVYAADSNLVYWDMMWGPGETYPDASKGVVQEFNETHSDINIEIQMTPWNNFYQTFLTAVVSGAAPDISTGAFPQAVQYAKMGEILSLDSIIEAWEEEDNPILDQFMEDTLTLKRYDGNTVGIPWNLDPRVIVYREDVFEEAGIEEFPTNWNEFIEVCKKIKENTDYIPFTYQGGEHSGTHALLNFMFTNGVGITDEELNSTINSEKMIETLEFFRTLYTEGLIPEAVASYSSSDTERLYISEKVAMRFGNPFSQLKQYPELYENTSILPPFAGPSGEARALVWVNSIMAYSQTEHPEAAREFIKWWSENNQSLWTEGGADSIPARLSYLDHEHFDEKLLKQIRDKVIPVGVSPVWPAESLYPAFSQIEGENYLGVLLQDVTTDKEGDVNIEELVEDYHIQITESLKLNN